MKKAYGIFSITVLKSELNYELYKRNIEFNDVININATKSNESGEAMITVWYIERDRASEELSMK